MRRFYLLERGRVDGHTEVDYGDTGQHHGQLAEADGATDALVLLRYKARLVLATCHFEGQDKGEQAKLGAGVSKVSEACADLRLVDLAPVPAGNLCVFPSSLCTSYALSPYAVFKVIELAGKEVVGVIAWGSKCLFLGLLCGHLVCSISVSTDAVPTFFPAIPGHVSPALMVYYA